ncbi:C-type lectin domain family 10 member A-like isoform X2 [Melanotaenia boesemani]|uniref:C-type lectin domain family 10 member A-like isoform X2 n=1 Tax=Melanotaenia boesemani TaxID=1250792 RepID=UPI001C05ACD0|nr:C-type lectin domain family 10 member A-like isoform X2 [Melanotaenia boesemani]
MEEIYENVAFDNCACPAPATDPRGSSSSKRRVYLAVILCLGVLSVCLLAGLIVLGVHHHISGEMAADLFAIKNDLSEHLQASKDNLSSLTEERNQLKANLSKLTEELNKLKHLSTQKKTCPAGWKMFSCSCYLFSTTSGSWDQGREGCRGRGADLVVIDNDEEQEFLTKFAKGKCWIGLSDKETEGTWKWVDGTNLTLTNWDTNQPDNGGGDPQWGRKHKWKLKLVSQ